MRHLLTVVIFCLLGTVASGFAGQAPVARGPEVFRALDNFDDNALDAAIWKTVLPFAGSTVLETNQRMEITQRGFLVTTGQMKPTAGAPVRVTGRFTFNNSDDFFQVLT